MSDGRVRREKSSYDEWITWEETRKSDQTIKTHDGLLEQQGSACMIALWGTKDGGHELFIRDLNPAIAVRVDSLEVFCELLDYNTCTNESIESNPNWLRSVARLSGDCSVFLLHETK